MPFALVGVLVGLFETKSSSESSFDVCFAGGGLGGGLTEEDVDCGSSGGFPLFRIAVIGGPGYVCERCIRMDACSFALLQDSFFGSVSRGVIFPNSSFEI